MQTAKYPNECVEAERGEEEEKQKRKKGGGKLESLKRNSSCLVCSTSNTILFQNVKKTDTRNL